MYIGGDTMKALITGASSGIGYEMAKYMASLGYDLILVARSMDKLEELKETLPTKVKIIAIDLADEKKIKELFIATRGEDVDVLINNAGFGVFGPFETTELNKEINMIDVNIKAVHILTKLYVKEMKKKNKGYILNVASSAAFQPGPLMAAYYASKAYVLRISEAINEELRKSKSKVRISCLCPGPVDTNFNTVAGVKFSIKPLSSKYVAQYAIDKMFQNKMVIIPGLKLKLARFFGRFVSDRCLMKIVYKIQKKKVQK